MNSIIHQKGKMLLICCGDRSSTSFLGSDNLFIEARGLKSQIGGRDDVKISVPSY
jgi:hypothetical protein